MNSLVSKPELTYYSGVGLRTDDCKSNGEAEVGFVGRSLNAFNAWEYGWESDRAELKENSLKVFDSYLKNGFTEAGFFKEFVNLDRNFDNRFIVFAVNQKESMQCFISWHTRKNKDVAIRSGNNG